MKLETIFHTKSWTESDTLFSSVDISVQKDDDGYYDDN